jgi:transcriptional regulator with XRE-family HTH domain
MSTLGERLRSAREKKKTSRREVSIALGVTEETVRAWEDDEGPGPRLLHAPTICQLFDVSVSWLVFGREKHVAVRT